MSDLIRCDEAAKILERSQRTLRLWVQLGQAPDGTRIRVEARDQFTNHVYYSRRVIERIANRRLVRV